MRLFLLPSFVYLSSILPLSFRPSLTVSFFPSLEWTIHTCTYIRLSLPLLPLSHFLPPISSSVDNPYDYLGRSYLHIPQDLDVDLRTDEPPPKCYVPKKLIHTWTGHTKGIAAMRLFPRSGHLLLTAGMDTKIKARGEGLV